MTARAVVPRLAVVLAVFSALIGAPSPAVACASMTFSIQLTDYVTNDVTPFYYAEEGDDAGPEFVVSAIGQVCPPDESGQVDYDTPPSGANPAEDSPLELLGDYQRMTGFSTFAANGTRRDEVQVPLHDDTIAEDTVAETFQVQLSNARGPGANMGSPSSAPFFIVDEEGPHRARFVSGATSAFENRGTFETEPIKIPVLRAGPTNGDVTFQVSPAGGEVFPEEGTVEFREDGRVGMVKVRIDDDTVDEPDEDFTISLGGAATEAPSTFQLTVDDNDLPGGGDEDTIAPLAWFHHPKQGERYRQGSFGADSIHLFVSERPQHVVNRIDWAKLALRKKLTNGNCAWWKNGDWRSGTCGTKKWVTAGQHYPNSSDVELYIYTAYDSLRPSVGTRIRSYTVYGRAADVAGNVSVLEGGRSANTFEVTRD